MEKLKELLTKQYRRYMNRMRYLERTLKWKHPGY